MLGQTAVSKKQIHGREDEIKWLEQGVNSLLQGQPVFRFLEGGVGIGKTALLEAAKKYFKSNTRHGRLIQHRFLPTYGESGKFGAWASILLQLATIEPDAEESREGRMKKFFSENKRALDVISEAMSVVPGVNLLGCAVKIGLAITDEDDSSKDIQRKLQKYSDSPVEFYSYIIRAFCRNNPLLIILDDIHWGDGPSISVFNRLIIDISSHATKYKLGLLGALRPPKVVGDTPGTSTFYSFLETVAARYAQDHMVELRQVGGLDKKAITSIIEQTLQNRSELSKEALEWLCDKTTGNPLMVERLIEVLTHNKIISLQNNNYVFSDDLVYDGEAYSLRGKLLQLHNEGVLDNLESLVEESLTQLSDEDLTILRHGGIQGLRFGAKALSASLEIQEEMVLEKLHNLTKSGYIRHVGEEYLGIDTQDAFSFSSDSLHRSVAKQLFPSHKRLISEKLADYYSETLTSLSHKFLQMLEMPVQSLIYLMKEDSVSDEKLLDLAVEHYSRSGNKISALETVLDYDDFGYKFREMLKIDVTSSDGLDDKKSYLKDIDRVEKLVSDCKEKLNIAYDTQNLSSLFAKAHCHLARAHRIFREFNQALQQIELAKSLASHFKIKTIKIRILTEEFLTLLESWMLIQAEQVFKELIKLINSVENPEEREAPLKDILYSVARAPSYHFSSRILHEILENVSHPISNSLAVRLLIIINFGTPAQTSSQKRLTNSELLYRQFSALRKLITVENEDTVFNLLLGYFRGCWPDKNESIVDKNNYVDKEAWESLNDVETRLNKASSFFNAFKDLYPWNQTNLNILLFTYAIKLAHSRDDLLAFKQEHFEANPDQIPASKTNSLNNLFNTLLEGSGELSKHRLTQMIRGIDLEAIPFNMLSDFMNFWEKAILLKMLVDPELEYRLVENLARTFEVVGNVDASIAARLTYLLQYDPYDPCDAEQNNTNQTIFSETKLIVLDEVQDLFQKHQAELNLESKADYELQIGEALIKSGKLDEGIEFLLNGITKFAKVVDYETFDNKFFEVEELLKTIDNQKFKIKINAIKKMAEKQQVSEVETPIVNEYATDEVDSISESWARTLLETSRKEGTLEQRLKTCEASIKIFDQLPFCKDFIAKAYNLMGVDYGTMLEYIIDEDGWDEQCFDLERSMREAFNSAYALYGELMDYEGILVVNQNVLTIYSKDNGPIGLNAGENAKNIWHDTLIERLELAMRCGLDLGVQYTFYRAIGYLYWRYGLETELSQDEINSYYEEFHVIPDNELVEIYNKCTNYLNKSGAYEFQDDIRRFLFAYAKCLGKADLLRIASKKTLYRVIFNGKILPGRELEDVKGRLAELKWDDKIISQLFSGGKVVFKKNLTYDQAIDVKDKLWNLGLIAKLEHMEMA